MCFVGIVLLDGPPGVFAQVEFNNCTFINNALQSAPAIMIGRLEHSPIQFHDTIFSLNSRWEPSLSLPYNVPVALELVRGNITIWNVQFDCNAILNGANNGSSFYYPPTELLDYHIPGLYQATNVTFNKNCVRKSQILSQSYTFRLVVPNLG